MAVTGHSLIGLDIGNRYIKAIQRSHGRIEAVAVVPRGDDEQVLTQKQVERIDSALFRQGFSGRRLAVTVGREHLMGESLQLPPTGSGAPTDQIARMELARMNSCEQNGFEMTYWPLPAGSRGGGATDAMATACLHTHAEAVIDPLEAFGFDVCRLDTPSLAVVRACEPLLVAGPAMTAIIDIGWTDAHIMMIHQGVIIYERQVTCGGVVHLIQAIEKQCEVEHDDAAWLVERVLAKGTVDQQVVDQMRIDELAATIVDEISNELKASISYATHRYHDTQVQRVLLTGGGATLPRVCQQLEKTMQIDVQRVSPVGLMACQKSIAGWCDRSMLVTAVGLTFEDTD